MPEQLDQYGSPESEQDINQDTSSELNGLADVINEDVDLPLVYSEVVEDSAVVIPDQNGVTNENSLLIYKDERFGTPRYYTYRNPGEPELPQSDLQRLYESHVTNTELVRNPGIRIINLNNEFIVHLPIIENVPAALNLRNTLTRPMVYVVETGRKIGFSPNEGDQPILQEGRGRRIREENERITAEYAERPDINGQLVWQDMYDPSEENLQSNRDYYANSSNLGSTTTRFNMPTIEYTRDAIRSRDNRIGVANASDQIIYDRAVRAARTYLETQ